MANKEYHNGHELAGQELDQVNIKPPIIRKKAYIGSRIQKLTIERVNKIETKAFTGAKVKELNILKANKVQAQAFFRADIGKLVIKLIR